MQSEVDPTRTSEAMLPERLPLPEVGTLLEDRYRLVRLIGAGGMGAVYEAEQVRVGRRCALKFLRTELSGRSRSEARFRREAQILGRLEHEHVTALLDYGVYLGKSPYLVMEYLDGCTLKSLLAKNGALPAAHAIGILQQVAEGMAYVHSCGIVHRDLKPDNLMLLSCGSVPRVKILDFGIARALDEGDHSSITVTGTDLGTVAYMSPEQARGVKTLTPGVDVFAIGTILYEALTGVRPHPGDSYNAVMFHLLTKKHERLGRVLPDCSPALETIVERCLEKDAARRYRDAGELLEALRAPTLAAEVTGTLERHEPSGWRRGNTGRSLLNQARLFVPAVLLGALVGSWIPGARQGIAKSPTATTQVIPLQPELGATGAELASWPAPERAVPDAPATSIAQESAGPPAPPSADPSMALRVPSPAFPPAAGSTLRASRTVTQPRRGMKAALATTTPSPAASSQTGVEDASPFVLINPYGAD